MAYDKRRAMMEDLRQRFRTVEQLPPEGSRDRRLAGKKRVKARKEQQRAERSKS